jgi:O-antigen ligase
MKKIVFSLVAGLVTWIVVASIGNRLLRASIAGYTDVEATMAFTQPMLLARLALGAVSSLLAGYVAAWVSGSRNVGAKALAVGLLVLFVPLHVALWAKFPAWYHLVFLASLVLLTLAGAKLRGEREQRVKA